MSAWESTKPSEKGDWASSALGVDKFHKSGAHKPARWGGENASSQETGVTVAEASIGAGKEFPEGKPYRVDKGLNAARKRASGTTWLHGSTNDKIKEYYVNNNNKILLEIKVYFYNNI